MPHKELLLGKPVLYKDQYDPSLLFPVPRSQNRSQLPTDICFHGVDIWNAYELSWLNDKGKPVVALGEFTVPFDSPNLIESKSLKLYLNSFNGSRFASRAAVAALMAKDLSAAAGAPVQVQLNDSHEALMRPQWPGDGICIDDLDVACDHYAVDAELLQCEPDAPNVRETL